MNVPLSKTSRRSWGWLQKTRIETMANFSLYLFNILNVSNIFWTLEDSQSFLYVRVDILNDRHFLNKKFHFWECAWKTLMACIFYGHFVTIHCCFRYSPFLWWSIMAIFTMLRWVSNFDDLIFQQGCMNRFQFLVYSPKMHFNNIRQNFNNFWYFSVRRNIFLKRPLTLLRVTE